MKKKLSEQEIKRKARRKKIIKRRIFIFLSLLIIVGIAALIILLYTKMFPIKNITVKGNSLYSSSEIIKNSGVKNNSPLLGVSKKSISKRILDKFSYIETVEVKKTLPDSVSITVYETDDYFSFEAEDGYFAVSKNGRVLNFYDELPENTVIVKTNSAKPQIRRQITFEEEQEKEIFDFLSSYPESLNIELTCIDITDKTHITVDVGTQFKVKLGNSKNLREKINHLSGMIPEIGDRKGIINLEMWSSSDSKGTFIAEN